jgi:hypothetical protein
MPTSPVPGERYILMDERDRRLEREQCKTPIEIAASAAEDRDGEAADTIEECKRRKRAA